MPFLIQSEAGRHEYNNQISLPQTAAIIIKIMMEKSQKMTKAEEKYRQAQAVYAKAVKDESEIIEES